MMDIEQIVKDLKEKLENGYFESMREEAHRIAELYEPKEEYDEHKLERDTKAVAEFCCSKCFRDFIGE